MFKILIIMAAEVAIITIEHCSQYMPPNLDLNISVKSNDLHLNHRSIIGVSGDFTKLKHLTLFEIQYNKLSNIPECIVHFPNLRILNLSSNLITVITDEIGMLHHLQCLYLSSNQISSVSPSLSNLVNLTELHLYNNILTEIPECIGHLARLRTLDLSLNRISHIPDFVFNLANTLKYLNLSHNHISEIPEWIERFLYLDYLNLSINRITAIPISIIRCLSLSTFDYHGNPVENIAPQVRRFLNQIIYRRPIRFEELYIYNDGENVHNHNIQKCIRQSIENITAQSLGIIDYDKVISLVLSDTVLTENTKRLILEYCENLDVHSTLQLTFKELLGYIWHTILKMSEETQNEVKQVMNSEMSDSECKCFTGRLSRLINSLNGFSPLVKIEIDNGQQIANIIALEKRKLDDQGNYTVEKHKEMVVAEMTERGYDELVINVWINAIE